MEPETRNLFDAVLEVSNVLGHKIPRSYIMGQVTKNLPWEQQVVCVWAVGVMPMHSHVDLTRLATALTQRGYRVTTRYQSVEGYPNQLAVKIVVSPEVLVQTTPEAIPVNEAGLVLTQLRSAMAAAMGGQMGDLAPTVVHRMKYTADGHSYWISVEACDVEASDATAR